MEKSPVLLFDGVCNLCNQAVQFVLKYDKEERLKFAALQSKSGQEILKSAQMNQVEFDTIVLFVDGKILTKSTAALALVKFLPRWRWLRILRFLPLGIRDKLYDLVAQNRYRLFGKKDSCMMPTPALKARFLP